MAPISTRVRSTRRTVAGRLLIAATAAFIAFATLISTRDDLEGWTFWCVVCGDHGVSDIVANLLLFLPLGVGCGLLGWRTRNAWIAGTGFSLAIELAQLVIPGRWATIGDVVFNGLGAAAGCYVTARSRSWLRPPARWAPWWSLMAATAVALVLLATGFLFAPALPNAVYTGNWTGRLKGYGSYEGRVLEARVGPFRIAPGPLPDSDSIRALLLGGTPLEAVVVAGPTPSQITSLAGIIDEERRPIFLLGVERHDLVFDYRAVADGEFTHPRMRFKRWLAGVPPGDTIRVSARRQRQVFCATLNEARECQGRTVGEGWSVLHTLEVFPWLPPQPVSALWLAGLMLPFGLWARRHPGSVMGGFLTVAMLMATPALTGRLLATPLYQLVALVSGICVGILIRLGMEQGQAGQRRQEGQEGQ